MYNPWELQEIYTAISLDYLASRLGTMMWGLYAFTWPYHFLRMPQSGSMPPTLLPTRLSTSDKYLTPDGALQPVRSALLALLETVEQAIDLRFELHNAFFLLREHERIFTYLHEAEVLSQAWDDRQRLGQVCADLSIHRITLGGHERALTY